MQGAVSKLVEIVLLWIVLPVVGLSILVNLANGGTASGMADQLTTALVGLENPFRVLLAALGGLFFLIGAAHLVWPSKHAHAWSQMGGSAGLIVVAWLFPEIMSLLAALASTFGPMALDGLRSAVAGHPAPAGSGGGTIPLPR